MPIPKIINQLNAVTKITTLFLLLFFLDNIEAQIKINTSTKKNHSNTPTLSKAYQNYFSIGVAISNKDVQSTKASNIIKKHFSSITAENSMKPALILLKNEKYNWSNADEIVNFASKNNIPMRGHTLVWHKQTPDWFFQDANGENLNKQELYTRLRNYMRAVMTRYDKDVYAWDVVNEAISDGGTNNIYREKDSKWFEICGEEFIEKAFRIAHSISPKTKLFYNDYNLINPKKQDKVYAMLKNLLDKGVPIDGIGLQAHWNINDSPEEVEKAIEKFSSLGLEIHITELDISFFKYDEDTTKKKFRFTKKMETKQAKVYTSYFEIFKKHSDVITSVSLWGVSDKDSWLNNFPVKNRRNYPLLFDDNYKPKQSFYSILNNNKN